MSGAAQRRFDSYDPAYQDYYMAAYPWAKSLEDVRKYANDTPYGKGHGAYDPMPYAEWKALGYGGQGGGGGGGGGNTEPPVVPPDLQGLIAQTADPFAVYGQMGVMEPYLTALNQRFGWDPAGVAYGQALNPALPTWYQPKTIYPDVVLPKISGAK